MLPVSIQLFQNCTGPMYKNEGEKPHAILLCEVSISLQIFVPKMFAVILAIKKAIVQPMLTELQIH